MGLGLGTAATSGQLEYQCGSSGPVHLPKFAFSLVWQCVSHFQHAAQHCV